MTSADGAPAASVLERIRAHAASRPPRVIDIPEWGLTGVHLKPLTLAQFSSLNRETSDSRKMARLLILSCRDGEGKPIFPDHAQTLVVLEGEADVEVVTRVGEEIMAGTANLDEAKND